MNCKCYLEETHGESGCVFDTDYDGDIQDCAIAPTVSCRENCYFWRPAKDAHDIEEIGAREQHLAISRQLIKIDAYELRGRGSVGPKEMIVLRKYGKI